MNGTENFAAKSLVILKEDLYTQGISLQFIFAICVTHSFMSLKVHKRENFLGFDFEICTFS